MSPSAVAAHALFAMFFSAVTLLAATPPRLVWEELPALPPSAGQVRQPGVASPFVGVHGDALLVAGGANFPGKMPWDGGAKIWWDDIWVLERTRGGAMRWVEGSAVRLPRRIGYGASASLSEGVVCAGGSDAERCFAEVFLLSWDAAARTVRRVELPSLPEPLANMAGALVGRTLYLAGGQHAIKGAVASSAFWALDLAKLDRPADLKWQALPSWPGPARVLPVAAALGGKFYLFSGRRPRAGAPTELLRDAYEYDPARRAWRSLPPVGGGEGACVMAGTAAVSPAGDEVWVFGGDRGALFSELEAHDLEIEAARKKLAAASASERESLERAIDRRLAMKRKIYDSHSGFGRDVFALDVQKNTWRVVTQMPGALAPQVTTIAVNWRDAIVIPSGEIRPGVRTPAVLRVGVER